MKRMCRETLAEAEMRSMSTLGWGPIIEIAMSACANLKEAFAKQPQNPRAVNPRSEETLAEAEMRAMSTLGWGPVIEIAMSAYANLKAAFAQPAAESQANRESEG